MNIYKVILKKERNQAFWEDSVLLIVAANYANAEDKAKSFNLESSIHSISIFGETTSNKDIFILRER